MLSVSNGVFKQNINERVGLLMNSGVDNIINIRDTLLKNLGITCRWANCIRNDFKGVIYHG